MDPWLPLPYINCHMNCLQPASIDYKSVSDQTHMNTNTYISTLPFDNFNILDSTLKNWGFEAPQTFLCGSLIDKISKKCLDFGILPVCIGVLSRSLLHEKWDGVLSNERGQFCCSPNTFKLQGVAHVMDVKVRFDFELQQGPLVNKRKKVFWNVKWKPSEQALSYLPNPSTYFNAHLLSLECCVSCTRRYSEAI